MCLFKEYPGHVLLLFINSWIFGCSSMSVLCFFTCWLFVGCFSRCTSVLYCTHGCLVDSKYGIGFSWISDNMFTSKIGELVNDIIFARLTVQYRVQR